MAVTMGERYLQALWASQPDRFTQKGRLLMRPPFFISFTELHLR
ncbi:hypothetical protein QBD01_001238 [Ochrobactrum sp. 19YEA23]|nr:hypothetical protein [Ochrobactrum sp. 19YEA23]